MARKKVGRWGVLVGIFLGFAVIWAWERYEERGTSPVPVVSGLEESYRDLRAEVRKRFEEAARQLNAETPKSFGDLITLRKVEVGEGPSMIYYYTVRGSEFREGQEARAAVLDQVCSLPEMRDYMQYGVHYDYIYETAEGARLFDFVISEEACKAHEAAKAAQPAAPAAGSTQSAGAAAQ